MDKVIIIPNQLERDLLDRALEKFYPWMICRRAFWLPNWWCLAFRRARGADADAKLCRSPNPIFVATSAVKPATVLSAVASPITGIRAQMGPSAEFLFGPAYGGPIGAAAAGAGLPWLASPGYGLWAHLIISRLCLCLPRLRIDRNEACCFHAGIVGAVDTDRVTEAGTD